MHKAAPFLHPVPEPRRSRPHLSATHVVRFGAQGDSDEVHRLVCLHAESGLVLPRTLEEIVAAIDDHVVVTDGHGRLQACAALQSYSPSLGEVASVVVAPEAQGHGLGSLAVRGVEALARRRGVRELFAVTRAERFFESLGYTRCALERYPEKLARYASLRAHGVPIEPKSCFRKNPQRW